MRLESNIRIFSFIRCYPPAFGTALAFAANAGNANPPTFDRRPVPAGDLRHLLFGVPHADLWPDVSELIASLFLAYQMCNVRDVKVSVAEYMRQTSSYSLTGGSLGCEVLPEEMQAFETACMVAAL